MALLEVENVTKEYRIPGQPPIPVLNGVSFSVNEGERVAITGRSGAGKTNFVFFLNPIQNNRSLC